jgi:hypothetical protein
LADDVFRRQETIMGLRDSDPRRSMHSGMKWAVGLAVLVAAIAIAAVTPQMFGHAPKAPPNATRYPVGQNPNADVPKPSNAPGSASAPGSETSPAAPAAPR